MKSCSVILAVILALLGGCATKPTQPDWINGDSATYSSSQYLIGRGQSSTREDAEDRARADLAKIFQVAVSVDSEDIQKFKSSPAGNGDGQYENQATRRVSTRTDQIISGIQIAELWQNPASNNFYVLATLPRLQAAASLRQQISQLDDATGNYIEQSRSNSDLFLKIAAASHALGSQQERDGLQKSLQVVDITGRGVESQWNSAKLKADLDALLKRVRIASQISADSPPKLAEIVSGALAQAGFMIETGLNPDFKLQARLELTDLGVVEGWYWQRGTLEITLSEVASGRVRGTQRWVIKSSALDKESAIERALNRVDAVLKKELRTVIVNIATQENLLQN
jgi:hypothetical protein